VTYTVRLKHQDGTRRVLEVLSEREVDAAFARYQRAHGWAALVYQTETLAIGMMSEDWWRGVRRW